MQCADCGESHCSTPGSSVVASRLRTIACKQHPTLRKSDSAVEIHKIIAILPFEIAGGAHNLDRPTFSRIKIRRDSKHGYGIRWHSVSSP